MALALSWPGFAVAQEGEVEGETEGQVEGEIEGETEGQVEGEIEGEGEGAVALLSIADIQGNGLASPLLGEAVAFTGVVTAVLDTGFFMQTPTSESLGDPAFSEGLFVATGGEPGVSQRDGVVVEGTVSEAENLTQVVADDVVVLSSNNSLPAPKVFTPENPSPENATPYLELEKFEGMRVSLTTARVLRPTDENGRILLQAALPRPFREPGILFPGLPNLPVWNGLPAAFSVQLDALGSSVQQLNAGALINATGILSQEGDEYVLYPSSYSIDEPGPLSGSIRERTFREFTLVSLNLEDFRVLSGSPEAIAAYEARKSKLVSLLRDTLHYPDILALQGASLNALNALRNDILDDEGPEYKVFMSESAETDGLESAFFYRKDTMVLTDVEEVDQFTRDSTDTEYLFANVPMIFRGDYIGGADPFPIRILNVDLLPLDGIGADGAVGERVRRIRREQAEFLAEKLQDYQTAATPVPTMLAGATNAFQFSDGYVDVMGILTGTAEPGTSLLSSPDIVDPPYLNQLFRLPAAQRYSAILPDGAAAALDHAIADEVMDNLISEVQYLHLNADAASGLAEDDENVFRTSSRDPLVVFVATATDIVVNSLEDTGDTGLSEENIELRDALSAVVDGGRIRFSSGLFGNGPQTLTVNPTLGPLMVPRNLTIAGPGQDLLTISGGRQVRVLMVNDGNASATSTVLIRDVTIADGETLSFEGGGIFSTENLTLRRVRLHNNESLQGGGVFSFGNLIVDTCIIENNIAGVAGGAISASFSDGLQVIDSTIANNNCTFGDGGGIFIETNLGPPVTIRNTTLSGNRAGSDGGALWNNSQAVMVNSTLSGNFALRDGGGVFDQSLDGLKLVQVTATGNIADHNESGSGNGGGLFSRFGGTTLRNTLVVGNEDRSNAGPLHPDISGTFVLDGNNVVGDGTGGTGAGTSDLVLSDLGFFGVADDVINPVLSDNGGPTATHALVSGSIAINAGDPDFAVDPVSLATLAYDQRGTGFPRVRSTSVDVGAYEQEIDDIVPTVTINQAADQPDPTNSFPIRFDAEFSKGVIGFDASMVTTGGTATGLDVAVGGGGSRYTIEILGAETDGTISVSLAAGVVGDPFGNMNEASESEDNEVTLDRTVPVITLLGRQTEAVECGSPYIEPGFSATDPFEGDLTDRVVVTGTVQTGLTGNYALQYNVADTAGNVAATVVRNIVVGDSKAPVMTVLGDTTFVLACGQPFEDPGVTAIDACDGNLTELVQVDASAVDTDTPGDYEVVYTVSDSKGNVGIAFRTVRVTLARPCITVHSGDWDDDGRFSLSEILRLVQFFNMGEFHCDPTTEDGYRPGPGDRSCFPHSSDFAPQDWRINLTELLRAIQFFNAGGYFPCPDLNTEDGFCPGMPPE